MFRPDLAVLDYAMPGANGLEAHIEIRRWSPATRCAILTGQTRPEVLAPLVEQGVDGILHKSLAVPELVAALRRIARGARILPSSGPEAVGLTPREFEVLCRVADGLSVRDIAQALSLSPKTIETHKASLMRKLGVNSSAALIVAAVRRGLLDLT